MSAHRFFSPIAIGIVVMVAILFTAPAARAQYFTINDYRADIQVEQDGTVYVTEIVMLTFDRQRHGIYRDLPIRYVDSRGDSYETPLKVLSVTDKGGQNRPYETKRLGNTLRIKIGNAHRYVRGEQTYVITYRVKRVVQFFQDHDELYWNVTGNKWQAPIEAVSATVTLNADRVTTLSDAACYTGRYGSNESACETRTEGNVTQFSTDRRLGVGEGFTIAFGWDKGLISPPSAWQKFLWSIDPRNNWVYVMPFLGLVWMFILWFRKGRDPRVRRAITVMYEPPRLDGRPLKAAEVGTLVDERLDQRDLSGAIVGLAEQGYLKIEETTKAGLFTDKDDYRFIKVKDPDSNLTPFETEVMQGIFEGGSDMVLLSDMRKSFYKRLPGLQKTLYRDLVANGFFAANPLYVKGRFGLYGILTMFVGVGLTVLTGVEMPIIGWVCAFVAGAIVIAFGTIMPAKTRKGALTRSFILGFQEFMMRADRDRIERMGSQIFYKYMPYAIALNVTDQWADAFAGLDSQPPDWYLARAGFVRFNTAAFASHLNTTTRAISQAVYSAPRGSGLGGGGGFSGGGGGFSGGGGGGGGGGSW